MQEQHRITQIVYNYMRENICKCEYLDMTILVIRISIAKYLCYLNHAIYKSVLARG